MRRRNPYKPRDYDDDDIDLIDQRGSIGYTNEMPTSVAIQIFSVAPSVAGAAALFLLSFKLAEATKVSVSEVIIASVVSAVGALSGLFIVKNFH